MIDPDIIRIPIPVPPKGCTLQDPFMNLHCACRMEDQRHIRFLDQLPYEELVHPACVMCRFYEGPVPELLQSSRESWAARDAAMDARRLAQAELMMEGCL